MGSLPGPPQRDNRGAADCNHAGLLAYACGSSVAIVELQSMQVVHTLWGDKPDVCVTAVRWSPEGLSRDLSRQSPLRLACGDSAGRVAIWDAARGELVTWLGLDRNGWPIVDLCWVLGRPWQLAVLQAPSSLLILDTTRFVSCTSFHGGYRYGQMQEWYLVLEYKTWFVLFDALWARLLRPLRDR